MPPELGGHRGCDHQPGGVAAGHVRSFEREVAPVADR